MSLGPFKIVVSSPLADPLAGKADSADLEALADVVDGKQSQSDNLDAIASLAPGENELIYWSGPAMADRTIFTPFARTLLTLPTADLMKVDLGLDDAATTAELGALNSSLTEAIDNEAERAQEQEDILSARQTRSERMIVDLDEGLERGGEASDIAFAVVDDAGRTAVDVTAARELRTGAAAFERKVGIGAYAFENGEDDGSFGPLVMLDPAGRVIIPPSERGRIAIRTLPGYMGDGIVNDSVVLATARDRARTLGLRYVDLQGTTAYAPDLISDGNVHFVNGRVTGRYGKRGAPLHRPAPTVGLGDLDGSKHLPTFRAAAAPVVVLTGDSTSTIYADTLQRRDSFSGMLEDALRRAARGKALTFHNRGIGGQIWNAFNSGPGLSKPYTLNALYSWWYTDANRDWLEYIRDLQPDAIFILFGMNDRENFSWASMIAAIAKIEAWTKVPDIVFVTTPQPQADQADEQFMSDTAQNGRDMAAGMTRTYAVYRGFGLLDANRVYNLKVRGLDPIDTSLATAIEGQAVTMPFVAADSYMVAGEKVRGDLARDYAAQITIAGLSSTTFAVGTPLRFRLSGRGAGSPDNDLLLWRDATTGKFAWNVRMVGSTMLFPADQISAVDCPTSGTISLRFQMSHGGHIRLGIAGIYVESEIVNAYVPRYGGVFRPAISGSAAATATISFWLGREIVYTPAYSTREIWGDATQPIATQQPLGGNGVNHPTDLGSHLIYSPVLEAARF